MTPDVHAKAILSSGWQPGRMNDLLSLSHVPRWVIVSRFKEQSVGDHTFRTLVIALEIASISGFQMGASGMVYALYHDADECRTGDISRLAKRNGMVEVHPRVAVPWRPKPECGERDRAAVILADMVEAYTWIIKNGDAKSIQIQTAIDALHKDIIDETLRTNLIDPASTMQLCRWVVNEEGR